jgi:hypothetical protein
MSAYARSLAAGGDPHMVFDWDKAAQLIRERQPQRASAGLRGDWEWTGGTIYQDGKPVTNDYTFLASNWATPELSLDGVVVECWRYQKDAPGWDSDTKWPESALAILRT